MAGGGSRSKSGGGNGQRPRYDSLARFHRIVPRRNDLDAACIPIGNPRQSEKYGARENGTRAGVPAARTCKPLTSRPPVNIGVRGPCYEMDDHALRSSRLKSSPLRRFLHHFPSCETEKLHHFPKYDIREALSRCRREGRFVAPPHPIRARKFYSVCFVPALRVLKRARKVQF